VTQYLISFDDGTMIVPAAELPAVADAAHAVIREAKDAGVYVLSGGLAAPAEVRVVGTDGTVSDGPVSKAYLAGFTIVEVPTRDEALTWAAKLAVACRCAQDVREIMADPDL
jgi:hypothetical protein